MLWRDLRAWQIYGANTDVGKTIISTILCKALARRSSANGLLYLKPVSTGPQGEADDRHIKRHVSGIISKCITQFTRPVSPHLAAKDFESNKDIASSDNAILSKVKSVLKDHSTAGGRYALLETAGAVLSPAPSGTVQADLYRPLRLPVLLVGDSRLGGIGSTISAFESLHVRGYDVESVLLFEDQQWGNHEYLKGYFSKHGLPTIGLPLPPARRDDIEDDQVALGDYYEQCSSSSAIDELIGHIHQRHFSRTSKLTSMSSHADSVIWHPFRQHQLPQNIIAIDSAYGDNFEVYNPATDKSLNTPETPSTGLTPLASQPPETPLLTPLFDASASWWTQGLGHGNPDLALTAAHAAGRYGHVMFANAVHEPALDLSYNLLSTLQNPRLSRVFFTDNGSTGMEVGVKMALRATCQRYGWDKNNTDQPVGILGLKGSYHGDTIGVMNCSEPNIYNEKVDWYKPWGYWLEPPEVKMKDGIWQVSLPSTMSEGSPQPKTFSSLASIFDFTTRDSDTAFYKSYITKTLSHLTKDEGYRFGALILEPLIMGAGGMIFVDPLFQRTLITTIRESPALIAPEYKTTVTDSSADNLTWQGLPFVADEVFTGLYRLGRSSSSSFLNTTSSSSDVPIQPLDLDISPDISVHAKLLTGGLLPLALTTASSSIFDTFLSDSKADALLHGHSYTAHPVGCMVANKSLDTMSCMNKDGSWQASKSAWSDTDSDSDSSPNNNNNNIFSFFNPQTLTKFSHHPKIESCFALGTVLSLTLKPEGGISGYSSTATASLQARLMTTLDKNGQGVHSRVLGNVIYFMTSLTTTPDGVRNLEETIMKALDGED